MNHKERLEKRIEGFRRSIREYDSFAQSIRAHNHALEASLINSQMGRNRDALVEISWQEAKGRNGLLDMELKLIRDAIKADDEMEKQDNPLLRVGKERSDDHESQ